MKTEKRNCRMFLLHWLLLQVFIEEFQKLIKRIKRIEMIVKMLL